MAERKPRTKDLYLICTDDGKGLHALDTGELADTLAAKKWLKAHELTGSFKIIAVKAVVNAVAETKTLIKFQ